ncbi:MAG: hypothetical protein Q4C95_06590 [Planctomycetia bacterium]|nr:hypothetical protein [Planctomycetia bacterium]
MNNATKKSDHWNEIAHSLNDSDNESTLEDKAEQVSSKNTNKKANAKKTASRRKASNSSVPDAVLDESEKEKTTIKNKSLSDKKTTSKSKKTALSIIPENLENEVKVDLTVGEEKPSRRRRSSKKSEKELIQEAELLADKSDKASKNKKKESDNPLSMLVWQIDELAQSTDTDEPVATKSHNISKNLSSKSKNEKTSNERDPFFNINIDSSDFSVEDFFSESNQDDILNISWGKKAKAKTVNSENDSDINKKMSVSNHSSENVCDNSSKEINTLKEFNENDSNKKNSKRNHSNRNEFVAQDKNKPLKESSDSNRKTFSNQKNDYNDSEKDFVLLDELKTIAQENSIPEEKSSKRRRHRRRNGKKEIQTVSIVNNITSDEVYSMSAKLLFDDQMNVLTENTKIFEEQLPEVISLGNNDETKVLVEKQPVDKSFRQSKRQEKRDQRKTNSSTSINNSNSVENVVINSENESFQNDSSEKSGESVQKTFPSWNDAISQVVQFNISRHSQRKENTKR